MKATISQAATLTGQHRDTILQWTKDYAAYLSGSANPEKGKGRGFSEADLCVLLLVAEETEMGETTEDIIYKLEVRLHLADRIVETVRMETPLFQEVPVDIEEDWQGALVGGMASRQLADLARSYKHAGDELLSQMISKYACHELDYPAIFLYRHSLELYLKSLLTNPPERSHNLIGLSDLVHQERGSVIPRWASARLDEVQRIDNHSDTFRYHKPSPPDELWVDFDHLKMVMDQLATLFESLQQGT